MMAGVREYTTKAPLEAYPSKVPISPKGGTYIAKPEKVRREPILSARNINERGIDERIERAEKIRQRANLLATPRSLERPPEQFLSPFDPGFKAQFEQKLYDYIEKRYGIPGGNPHKMNIMGMVEEISAERLPELWDNFTGKRVLWEDRERVRENNSKAWNAWIQAINQYRSKIGSVLKMRQTDAIRDYEYQMSKLDTRIEIAKANLINTRKERLRQIEKAPQYRVNAVGELTLHELDEASDKWVDTGKKKTPPERPQLVYDTKLGKSVYKTTSQMRKDLKEDPFRYGEKPKEEKEEKPEKDELKKAQMLDDWRADYKTRLNQLKDDYGDFNPMTGLWVPNRETYKEYKKTRDKLIKEYEEGTRSILKGKVPKRMTGALAIESKKKDYVSDLIKNLTEGY